MIRGYSLPIYIHQTAATAAPATVWAMRNLGRNTLYLSRFYGQAMFSGTAAATESTYFLETFNTATPTAGAALSVAVKNPTDGVASTVTDARFLDTGLTVAGVVFGNPLLAMGCSRQVSATAGFNYVWDPPYQGGICDSIVIPPLYGLAIVLGAAAVIGDALIGSVEWVEVSQGA